MPEVTPLPPERIARWLASVDDAALRVLDEQLLLYLLIIEDDETYSRDIANVIANYLRAADEETVLRFQRLCQAMGKRIPADAEVTARADETHDVRHAGRAWSDRDIRPALSVPAGMAAIGQLYSSNVAAAHQVWEAARTEGIPDLTIANEAVEELTEAVTRNRGGMLALTSMSPSGDYTFTHMVNVAILTMALARTIGIEGQLLLDIGLAALLHDIGKVRTPKEILNKPRRLTDAEFRIIERHTVDGAEILRRTPGMPTLAPVVAFEHHLRIDGSGYPTGARRHTLNLGTMMCSIADVYDAMRSHRTYQEQYGSERILNVLRRKSDRPQFDPTLVQRFAQLLGLRPHDLQEPWPSPND